jgi:hypothetical protein
MTEQQRHQLCVHESAHCILRESLNPFSVYYVTACEDNPRVCVASACASQEDENAAILGGLVAEFTFFPYETASANGGGHFGDDDLQRVSESARPAAVQLAKALVAKHRNAIGRLADELLTNGVLIITGEHVREILKGEANQ